MLEEEVRAFLQKQPVFAGLEAASLAELARLGEPQSFSIGKNICDQGDPGDAAFLVYSGKVRVVRSNGQGQSVTVGVLSRGEFFGERAIIAGEIRNATVRASEDVVVVRFSRPDFQRFLASHPELKGYFDSLIAERALATFLRSSTILKAVPPREIRDVVENLKRCSFQAGQTVFAQGDPGDRLYIIKQGEAPKPPARASASSPTR